MDQVRLTVPNENENTAKVYLGSTGHIVLSNDTLNAIFKAMDYEVYTVEEPQIAGVSDEDIKDDTKPVEFEDIVDVNDVERSEDKVVEGTEDLTV